MMRGNQALVKSILLFKMTYNIQPLLSHTEEVSGIIRMHISLLLHCYTVITLSLLCSLLKIACFHDDGDAL